jgi:hypothetical protein
MLTPPQKERRDEHGTHDDQDARPGPLLDLCNSALSSQKDPRFGTSVFGT